MRDRASLERTLETIDGRGYASYKQLRGSYDLGLARLAVDHVQVDPYAPPSRMRLVLDHETADLPADLIDTADGRIAVGDFLARCLDSAARRLAPKPSGNAGGGPVSIGRPGQQVLERASVLVADDRVEARIEVELPASGRRVRGRDAARILTEILPELAETALRHANLDQAALRDHVVVYRDQLALRARLADHGLVAFVGDGSILPRRSGDSDLPLVRGAVPFTSPDALRVAFDLPSGRQVTGMGVPEGVTVIVGGGYHGKSTLLRAIERGVYPHIEGDGREWVVTRPDAAAIRAEDGRAVTGVDISPFIGPLPSGVDTRLFSTTNASGSTSQAANLVEALEAGASALLIDEDTSATNFMIRDERMRQLVPSDREPITPFLDRIRPLFTERGVSTILVAGGSGAFFDVADHVLALDAYHAEDVTDRARRIADDHRPHPESAPTPLADAMASRVPESKALRPREKTKPARSRGSSVIQYGQENIDLSAVAQLVDRAQTEAIARALDRFAELADGRRSIPEIVAELCRRIDEHGLDWLSPHQGHPGNLARPRPYEIHAAVNRYRGLALNGADQPE